MDLLGAYVSDAEGSQSEEDVPKPSLAPQTHDSDTGFGLRKAASNGLGEQVKADGILDVLPAPKTRTKKPVHFRIPINVAPESDDEEDERPKKKTKVTTKGLKLTEVLPAPKLSEDSSSTAGLLGAGYAKGGTGGARLADSDDEMTAPDPYRNEVVLGEDNEAFRVFDEPEGIPPTAAGEPSGGHTVYGSCAPADGAAVPAVGDQMLQQALQEEAARAGRAGMAADPFAGLHFKEVKQEKLTYMPPEQREAQNATRTALGADYEARIRSEAGPQPEKTARRKHQIQSLYHQAKLKELEMMDLRGQAVKSKRETQAKYGWS